MLKNLWKIFMGMWKLKFFVFIGNIVIKKFLFLNGFKVLN